MCSSKDDGISGEVESKTTKDVPKEDSTTEEGLKDEMLMAKEDSVVKEKETNKEKNPVTRENSMEESLLCGICQVSLHTCSLLIIVYVHNYIIQYTYVHM